MFKNLDLPINNSNLESVKILNRARFIAIFGQLALLLFASLYLDIRLPIKWLSTLIGLEICFALYCYRIVNNNGVISSKELFLHLVIDSLVLAGLIYFSGGANNPFIYLLLLLIALGSFMLTPRYLLLLTGLQLFLYSLLNIFQRSLELGDSSPLASFHFHLAGMWINFILTAVLIAIFGLLARRALLNQEKKLQSLRENILQDEQMLGLGIMSASAAHELGTPLSTMSIIIDDIQHSNLSKDLHSDMQLLALQIANCKKIIGNLSDKSGHVQQELNIHKNNQSNQIKTNFKKKLQLILDNWLVYRPHIVLSQKWMEGVDSIEQNIPISVEQAITNFLDNAADASIDNDSYNLEFVVSSEQQKIEINIFDFGRGISKDIKESLGMTIQKTKKRDGLGWGVLLSNASIERAGGKVQLLENKPEGTLTRITLPMISNL